MAFIDIAVGMGLEGIAADMAAGAMMGGVTSVGSNLLQGKDAFSNIGQGILMGGAFGGITSAMGYGGADAALNKLKPGLLDPVTNLPVDAYGLNAGETPLDTTIRNATDPVVSADTPSIPSGTQINQETGETYSLSAPPDTPAAPATPTAPATATPAAPAKQGMIGKAWDWAKANPVPAGLGALALYKGLTPATVTPATPSPGGNINKYEYHPAQYGPDGKLVSAASYGTPTITHYAASGGMIPGFADGAYIPQSKDIHTNIYGSNAGPSGTSGKQMFKNTDKYAVLQEQMDKMSPSMLSRLSKSGTDPIIQAAATTELYDRVSHPNPAYIDQTPMQTAQGGIIGMAMGGYTSSASSTAPVAAPRYNYNPADQSYTENPQAQIGSGAMSGLFGDGFSQAAMQSLFGGQSSAPVQYSFDPNGQNFTKKMAMGGIASLPNEYAAGGKLLQGPGDGMSDSIPAVIKGDRPQRAALAQGEFVVPADVVSHLGNGSTDAGAKRLYAMMDKIRHARTGNKKQGKQINPANFLPA